MLYNKYINLVKQTLNESTSLNFEDVYKQMIIIEKFDENSIKDLFTKVKEFKDDELIFIHMSELNKVGINPKTDFNTPVGIYCYPVNFVYNILSKNTDLPFGRNRKYYHILKANSNIKIWHMDDRYNSKVFDDDIEKLINFAKEYEVDNKLSHTLKLDLYNASKSANYKTPSGIMWYLLFEFSKLISENPSYNKKNLTGSTPLIWNILLKKILNYDLIIDVDGIGIIHSSEPTQAMFTHSKAFKQIYSSENTKTKYIERINNVFKHKKWDDIPDDFKTNEIYKKLIEINPDNIKYIKNPNEEIQKLFIMGVLNITNKNQSLEELQKKLINKNPYLLNKINNPSEQIQKIAFANMTGIKFNNQSLEELQKQAVEDDPTIIKYIKNPSKVIQKISVDEHQNNIQYIKNPSEDVQKLALEQDPFSIKYIKNPSEDIQKFTIDLYPDSIQYIKNPSEDVQKLAVQENPDSIQYIKNPSEDVQKTAVQEDPDSIQYIKNPSEIIQKLAVQEDPDSIQYIKNPSKDIQKLIN